MVICSRFLVIFFESSFPSEYPMSIQKATLEAAEQLHNPIELNEVVF